MQPVQSPGPALGAAVVVPVSRRKVALLLAGCAAFVAAGVFLIVVGNTPRQVGSGIVGVVIFGGGGIVSAVLMRARLRPLRIDANGIQGLQLREPIAWRDVTCLALRPATDTRRPLWYLAVYVAEAVARKPAKRERFVPPVPGSLSVSIPLHLLALVPEEIVAVVERFSGIVVDLPFEP
jgi:hypothetical protein